MEGLQAAIETGLAGRRSAALTASASRLMAAYRNGTVPATRVISSGQDAAAYAAYRMPATAAAAAAALRQAAESLPGWAPVSLADLGAGTGGTAWAAVAELPSLQSVSLLDESAEVAGPGRAILGESGSDALRHAVWQRWRLPSGAGPRPARLPAVDLITAGYLLGELTAQQQRRLVELAMAAAPVVVFIEPGSPAGHRRVLAARDQLLAGGFTVAAPCPHQLACPLDVEGDWCHFAARLPRSAVLRQVKDTELGYEDEKFSFVAAARDPGVQPPRARIVRRPQQRKHLVSLGLCGRDGTARQRLVAKSEGPPYRAARKATWGGRWEAGP